MAEESDLEKTEEPTHRKLEEAVKKGQVSFSREITNFLVLAVLALHLAWFLPSYAASAYHMLTRFIESPEDIPLNTGSAVSLVQHTMMNVGKIMLAPVALIMVVMLLSSILQNGVVISTEPMTPKLEKISPLKGIKRLFSLRQFMEFVKGILKITLVAVAAYMAVAPETNKLEALVSMSMAGIMAMLDDLALKLTIAAASVMLIFAFLDYTYQRFEYMKSLRMTKQEIKDEYKQSEGDPHIKGKLKQLRMERARKRMMAAVPDADVVVRNPQHYAVALKYDQLTMVAPVVIAKGQDNIALKIIEVAEANNIPTVENRPLARALFNACDIDEQIPFEHYQAVAEIISYVYKLKGKAA